MLDLIFIATGAAFLAVCVLYAFARIGTVVAMRGGDYDPNGKHALLVALGGWQAVTGEAPAIEVSPQSWCPVAAGMRTLAAGKACWWRRLI